VESPLKSICKESEGALVQTNFLSWFLMPSNRTMTFSYFPVTLVLIWCCCCFLFQQRLRKNAMELEKKEQKERELRAQIIAEAEEFKKAFFEKRIQNCASNMVNNREREKVCDYRISI
jgi:uncharacterized membrane protein